MGKLPPIMQDLICEIYNGMPENGASSHVRLGAAEQIALRFFGRWEKREIYIPSTEKIKRMWRNRKIIQQFEDGVSIEELARQYDLSDHWIIQIITADALAIDLD